MTTDANGFDGLRQGAGAAYLDHMIDTTTAGQLANLFAPGLQLAIIDDVNGTECTQAVKFSPEDDVAITVAPMSLAIWMAAIDTPPVPIVRTVSPAFSDDHQPRGRARR